MITREQLNKLHELTQKVNDQKELASELLRTAQDRHKTRTHKILREGKEIEVTEKTLWDEVFYLGPACEAGQVLREQHPEVFDAYKKQDEAAAQLKKFCVVELGVDYTQLTLSDYLRTTESLFMLMLTELGFDKKDAQKFIKLIHKDSIFERVRDWMKQKFNAVDVENLQ